MCLRYSQIKKDKLFSFCFMVIVSSLDGIMEYISRIMEGDLCNTRNVKHQSLDMGRVEYWELSNVANIAGPCSISQSTNQSHPIKLPVHFLPYIRRPISTN
jgi:hypothetical protein